MYVDYACRNRCLFNRVWGWTRGGRFGSAFGRHPLANFCATLHWQMAIVVGNPCAIFHSIWLFLGMLRIAMDNVGKTTNWLVFICITRLEIAPIFLWWSTILLKYPTAIFDLQAQDRSPNGVELSQNYLIVQMRWKPRMRAFQTNHPKWYEHYKKGLQQANDSFETWESVKQLEGVAPRIVSFPCQCFGYVSTLQSLSAHFFTNITNLQRIKYLFQQVFPSTTNCKQMLHLTKTTSAPRSRALRSAKDEPLFLETSYLTKTASHLHANSGQHYDFLLSFQCNSSSPVTWKISSLQEQQKQNLPVSQQILIVVNCKCAVLPEKQMKTVLSLKIMIAMALSMELKRCASLSVTTRFLLILSAEPAFITQAKIGTTHYLLALFSHHLLAL